MKAVDIKVLIATGPRDSLGLLLRYQHPRAHATLKNPPEEARSCSSSVLVADGEEGVIAATLSMSPWVPGPFLPQTARNGCYANMRKEKSIHLIVAKNRFDGHRRITPRKAIKRISNHTVNGC